MVVMCVEKYSGTTAFISGLDDILIMPQMCGNGRALCDWGVKKQFNLSVMLEKNRLRLSFFGGGGIQPDGLLNGLGVNGLPLKLYLVDILLIKESK